MIKDPEETVDSGKMLIIISLKVKSKKFKLKISETAVSMFSKTATSFTFV